MSTYPIEHVLLEYKNSRMTVEMALGHNLRHTEKLYQAQTVLSVENLSLKTRLSGPLRDAKRYLEVEAKSLREEVEHLKATLKKLPKGKPNGQSE